jgi:hypothetical protein
LVFCKIENLQNGVPYNVWAEALYPDGHSSLSASLSAKPRARPQGKPGAFIAYANDRSLDLTWDEVYDADYYTVYWNAAGGAEPPDDSSHSDFTVDDDPIYRQVMGYIDGLSNGSLYNVWIQARNTSGASNEYAHITGTPSASVSPSGAPNKLFLAPGDTILRTEWNAVRGAAGYKLYYKLYNSGDAWSSPGYMDDATEVSVPAGARRINYAINGLTNGKTYYVRVKAANGGSMYSELNSEAPKPKPALNMNNPLMHIGEVAARFPNEEAGKGDRLSRKQETALANLFTDSMYYWANKHKSTYGITTNVDFAFVNGGVITGALPAGAITVKSITGIAYGDKMSYVTMTGANIKRMFYERVASVPHSGGGGGGTGAFGQVSAQVRYTIDYNYDPRGGVLSGLTFNGAPFDDNTEYTFITNTWLMDDNTDGYVPYLNNRTSRKDTGLFVAEAVCDWIYDQNFTRISPVTDGRITLRREVWQQ